MILKECVIKLDNYIIQVINFLTCTKKLIKTKNSFSKALCVVIKYIIIYVYKNKTASSANTCGGEKRAFI